MTLTNSQYDEIMRGYEWRASANRAITAARLQEAYSLAPRLKEIEADIARSSVRQATRLMDGDSNALDELKNTLKELRAEKESILSGLGFPAGYFDPVYSCPSCKDTGYIDNKKCNCFKQQAINLVYSQSNIDEILKKENFDTFTYDYYSNPTEAEAAVAKCKNFISNFDDKPRNILFFGNTGTGKTFLSNCIAKELLDKGYSVIYFTAFSFFDILSKGAFRKDDNAIEANQMILDCDLLIIDDLGTEVPNSFTTAALFQCLNERLLQQKSTIISTNLNFHQLEEIYSERTGSRIFSNYDLIKMTGDDIRVKKRML